MLGRLLERVRAHLRRGEFEDELERELSFHLDMEVEKNVALGMAPERARLEARRSFGGVARTKEDVRASRGLALVDALSQDLRDARRALVVHAVGSAVIVGTLALAIGANASIFSAIYGVLLRPLPYASGEHLVLLTQSAPQAEIEDVRFSVDELEQVRRESRTLDAVVEYHTMPFILLGHGDPERVRTGVVSADFFDVFGVSPIRGRTFLPGEDALGAEPVLVLSYEYWKTRFDGDSTVVGRMLEMNDRPHRVVGVLPPLPHFPDRNDVFMPVSACPFHSAPAFLADRSARMMRVFGRRRGGVPLEDVQSELTALSGRMQEAFPAMYPERRGHAIVATHLRDELTRAARPTFLLLLGTAGCVLLVACANVANVTLARVLRRRRELELRRAIGASRARIARQLLAEASLLACLGGGLGLGLAWVSLDLIVAFAARFTPRAGEIALDGTVLWFTLALSLGTGLLFGTLPALLPRAPMRGHHVRRALVTAQVAVSLVLLAGAGLMLRSLLQLQRVDPGFDSQHVLTMLVDLNWSKYDESGPVRGFHEKLLQSVESHPSVISAAVSRSFPLAQGDAPQEARFELEPASGRAQVLDVQAVSQDYFRTIGVPLIEGRFLSEDDRSDAAPAVLVNRAAAEKYWPEQSPVGRELFASDGTARIVGVVDDVRQYRLDAPAAPTAYVSVEQFPLRVSHLVLRTSEEPSGIADEIKARVHGIDPEQAVASVQTLASVKSESLAAPRLTTSLLTMFAALALVITVVGLSGVLALSVSQRESELGIRMALGASRMRVLSLVLQEALVLIAAGVVVGTLGFIALRSVLTRHLFEVEPSDPVTLSAVGVVLLGAALAACWLPARRAANIDPRDSLRTD